MAKELATDDAGKQRMKAHVGKYPVGVLYGLFAGTEVSPAIGEVNPVGSSEDFR